MTNPGPSFSVSAGWTYAGMTADEARGWGWAVVIHHDDAPGLTEYWTGCLTTGTPVDTEARMRGRDGSYRWFLFRANPRDESGTIVSWYGTNIDIEDRKLADNALVEARSELERVARITALGALTASIAHEVSQPLSGIITNAGTCLRFLAADPPNIQPAQEAAQRIVTDSKRASDVIARLRSLFARKSGTTEAFDLNAAAREVVALAANTLQRNRVVLDEDLDEALPRVLGDRVQLQQVILNLLVNASDAMRDVRDRRRQIILKTQVEEGNRVRLSVQDAGAGIDPQHERKLFEPFFTTKDGGMGVGLSISHSIIERHRGRLWATPNAGSGATFAFSVPVGTD
jgi:PAS domain S-box-containing protein